MIDKELIHQAAEDIDLFNDDFTEEFDRIKAMTPAPRKKPVIRWMRIGISAAACLVCAFILYSHLIKEDKQIAHNNTHHEQVIKAKTPAESNKKEPDVIVEEQTAPYIAEEHTITHEEEQIPAEIPQSVEQEEEVQPEAIYASNTTSKQEEWGLDIYISQLCKQYGVEGQELSCNNEDKSTGTVYVFPDDKKVNLFSRFQQIACRYDEHKGFRLSYSHQQFYFQLTDKNNGGKELWLAERVSNRIYMYRTHSAVNASFQTACYAKYKQKSYRTSSIYC